VNEEHDSPELDIVAKETREGTKFIVSIKGGPRDLTWAWTEHYARQHGTQYVAKHWRLVEGTWRAGVYS
jgi:hypothetical protein